MIKVQYGRFCTPDKQLQQLFFNRKKFSGHLHVFTFAATWSGICDCVGHKQENQEMPRGEFFGHSSQEIIFLGVSCTNVFTSTIFGAADPRKQVSKYIMLWGLKRRRNAPNTNNIKSKSRCYSALALYTKSRNSFLSPCETHARHRNPITA